MDSDEELMGMLEEMGIEALDSGDELEDIDVDALLADVEVDEEDLLDKPPEVYRHTLVFEGGLGALELAQAAALADEAVEKSSSSGLADDASRDESTEDEENTDTDEHYIDELCGASSTEGAFDAGEEEVKVEEGQGEGELLVEEATKAAPPPLPEVALPKVEIRRSSSVSKKRTGLGSNAKGTIVASQSGNTARMLKMASGTMGPSRPGHSNYRRSMTTAVPMRSDLKQAPERSVVKPMAPSRPNALPGSTSPTKHRKRRVGSAGPQVGGEAAEHASQAPASSSSSLTPQQRLQQEQQRQRQAARRQQQQQQQQQKKKDQASQGTERVLRREWIAWKATVEQKKYDRVWVIVTDKYFYQYTRRVDKVDQGHQNIQLKLPLNSCVIREGFHTIELSCPKPQADFILDMPDDQVREKWLDTFEDASSAMFPVPDTVLTGWCMKGKRKFGKYRGWQKRWFLLDQSTFMLSYYTREPDGWTDFHDCKGTVGVAGSEVEILDSEGETVSMMPKGFSYGVEVRQAGSVWCYGFESSPLRDDFAAALQKTIDDAYQEVKLATMTGWLLRKGANGKFGKIFAVLTRQTLVLFLRAEEGDKQPVLNTVDCSLLINDAHLEKFDFDGQRYHFRLTEYTKRREMLACDAEKTYEDWCEALEHKLDINRGKDPTMRPENKEKKRSPSIAASPAIPAKPSASSLPSSPVKSASFADVAPPSIPRKPTLPMKPSTIAESVHSASNASSTSAGDESDSEGSAYDSDGAALDELLEGPVSDGEEPSEDSNAPSDSESASASAPISLRKESDLKETESSHCLSGEESEEESTAVLSPVDSLPSTETSVVTAKMETEKATETPGGAEAKNSESEPQVESSSSSEAAESSIEAEKAAAKAEKLRKIRERIAASKARLAALKEEQS